MLGGSFDPPHIGHVILAQEVLWQLELDEVLLVPCRRSPHKPGGHRFDPELRLRMVEAAIQGHAGLMASRAELDREPPSFTVETLRLLSAEEPDTRLWLVVGADQLQAFSSWRDPEAILRLARLAAVDRGPAAELPDGVLASRVDHVTMPRIDLSSTDIRHRLDAGAPIWHLVPPGVVELLQATRA
jgi:nicotinate-nucleotide adenylyltransferase